MRLGPGRLYGKTLTTQEFAGIQVLDSAYPPGLRLPKHSHERGCFSILLRGAFSETYQNKHLEWEPFCVGFNPPDEEHSNLVHRVGAYFLVIELSHLWFERAHDHSVRTYESTLFRGGPVTWLGKKLYGEFRNMDEVSPLSIEGIVLEMIAEVSRQQSGISERQFPRWLEQAREFVHAHFTESLTVKSIAEAVGVHPVHLARTFRKHHRLTIGSYVRQLRIELACREISKPDVSLAEIASLAGFYDQGHFSKVFKNVIGLTPAQYRATLPHANRV
jgi:AraC family transcriptional regulator